MALPNPLELQIAKLMAENAALKAAKAKANKVSCSVSERTGAIIIRLGGRFPTTLYRDQAERLLDAADEIRAFIKDNEKLLSVEKSDSAERAAAYDKANPRPVKT